MCFANVSFNLKLLGQLQQKYIKETKSTKLPFKTAGEVKLQKDSDSEFSVKQKSNQ